MVSWCLLAICIAVVINDCRVTAVDDAKKEAKASAAAYRLPRSIRPDYYRLHVLTHIDDDEGFKFNGEVAIKVSLGTFFFHSYVDDYF